LGGLWLRPPAAGTVGPACRLLPWIADPADQAWERLVTHFANELLGEPGPATVAESELSGDVPWADRRLADRLQVRPGSRTEIRRAGAPFGPELAEELIDVSAAGVGVRLGTPVGRGARLDVTLWGPAAAWCGRGTGLVCWSVIGEGGKCLVGIRLSRRLTARALRDLAVLPAAGHAGADASPGRPPTDW
jgi:hypothetical protein